MTSRVQEVIEQHSAHHNTIKPGLCLECDLVHEIMRLRDELAHQRSVDSWIERIRLRP